jgi:hypothetical protein
MSLGRLARASAAFVGAILWASAALADPEVRTTPSARRVEVGEAFTIQMTALVEPGEPMPSDPQLKPPQGASIVGGPSVGTSMVIVNGAARMGIQATWQVVSQARGKAHIPAPTVLWRGKRFSGQAIQVEVVPSTGKPRRGQNPFLLPGGPGFGSLFGGLDPFANDEPDEALPAENERLDLDKAPDPYVFVHARADKLTAVVGEQVTVSFYVYHRSPVGMDDRRDPSAADFLRWSMLSNPGAEPLYRARAGRQTYTVQLAERLALFPMRAGDLHVGALSYWFTGRQIGRHALRASEDVVIEVREPPRDMRPAGYVLGDVGRFSLTASVEPRRVTQGGSVAVTVRVTGNGNFPQTLAVPARTGVEWLDPEKRESISPQAGIIAGYRSFGYVVRVKEAGTVDLGKIDLPHWDPTSKKYEVASVELGTIEATPAPASASSSSAGSNTKAAPPGDDVRADPFATLPAARNTLGAYEHASGQTPALFDGARLYAALAAPPLAYVVLAGAGAFARRVRARRDAGATSPSRLAIEALDDADRAAAERDAKDVSAAVERAIHHAVESATGLKSRGILIDELEAELEAAGLPEDLAAQTRALLDVASAMRFDPGATTTGLEDLARRGRALVRELLAARERSAT